MLIPAKGRLQQRARACSFAGPTRRRIRNAARAADVLGETSQRIGAPQVLVDEIPSLWSVVVVVADDAVVGVTYANRKVGVGQVGRANAGMIAYGAGAIDA